MRKELHRRTATAGYSVRRPTIRAIRRHTSRAYYFDVVVSLKALAPNAITGSNCVGVVSYVPEV